MSSIILGDTLVTTVAITGKDLRDRDVIVHPSGQFPPIEVCRVIMRDEYGVIYRGRVIRTDASGTVTREGIAECLKVGNLATLHVERAS